MNNKGFTLIELIAAIVLLALVAGITTYSVTNIIRKNREENYNLLIKNINSAAETYYQECTYSKEVILDMMNDDENAFYAFCDYNVSLGELVTYGYLQGNTKIENGNNKDKYKIVNPLDNSDISNCEITVSLDNGKVKVTIPKNSNCPSSDVETTNEGNNTDNNDSNSVTNEGDNSNNGNSSSGKENGTGKDNGNSSGTIEDENAPSLIGGEGNANDDGKTNAGRQ